MSIFKNGIKVTGQFELGGSTGDVNSIPTGGATPGFTPFDTLQGRLWQNSPAFSRKVSPPRKLLVLGIGNSNWAGFATLPPNARQKALKPMPGVFEVSQGRETTQFPVPPAGELMQMRAPNQDAFEYDTAAASTTPTTAQNWGGPKLPALKRFKELFPAVEEVAMLTNGIVGSGLYGVNATGYRNVADWRDPARGSGNDGQALLKMVADANAFLAAHPDYEFGWVCCQSGPLASFAAASAEDFTAEWLAMQAYVRANVTGGENAVFTIHGLHPTLIDVNLTPDSGGAAQPGTGTAPEIEVAIQALPSEDPLGLTAAFAVTDLDAIVSIHHTGEEYFEIGRRHADAYFAAVAGADVEPVAQDVRLLPSKDGAEFKCAVTGCRVFEPVTEFDSRYGYVLRATTAGYGFQTDATLNRTAHTIFARVRWVAAAPAETAPLFSGKKPTQADQGRVVELGNIEYGDGGTALDPQLDDSQANALTQHTWCSLALVFDGTQFEVFKNGVSIASGGAPATGFTDSETVLELMGYGQDSGSTTTADAQMTDIRVAARALTSAEVLAWHQDTPTTSEVPIAALRSKVDDPIGEATFLGVNPTIADGTSWQNQISPGVYTLYYSGAGLSIANGLPWSATDWGGTAQGGTNALDLWFVEIDVFDATQAQITCTTYAYANDGGADSKAMMTRTWRKSMTRGASDLWVGLSDGYPDSTDNGWEELTPYAISPNGSVFRTGVANDGSFSSTAISPA